ncbi:hypothetical protein [Pedobacter sp.]|uniref:hypothetical protein n=1 Tax=Pedobacter sp. TaxID=1411316 RepID=UPI003BAD5CCE
MSGKTIFIIILTALLTAFLFLNSDEVPFNFIVVNDVLVSKLLVIGVCVVIGFIIGFIVARPKKTVSSYDDEIEKNQSTSSKKELSDEDRDYIS